MPRLRRAGRGLRHHHLSRLSRRVERLAVRDNALEHARNALAARDSALDKANGHLYVSRFHRAWQSWQSADMASLDRLLEELRPAAVEADLRGWEWSFLRGLGHQERRSLDGHAGPVLAAAWSPDGRRLATAGEDRRALVWDVGRGGPPSRVAERPGAIRALAWSPDGRRLAFGGDDRVVEVRDMEHDRALPVEPGSSGVVRSIAWDPAGRRLAVAGEAGVYLRDDEPGARARPIPDASTGANAVAWSPDGRRLAWGGDEGWVGIAPVEAASGGAVPGGTVRSRRHRLGWVNAVAWSPDGGSVASVGQDGTLRIWDATTGGARVVHATTTGAALTSLAWAPDGESLAAGGADWTVTLWDASEGRPLRAWRGHRDIVRAVAWAPAPPGVAAGPRGRPVLASGGDDRSVKLWSPSDPDDGSTVIEQPAPVKSIAWLADGSAIVAMDLDGAIRLHSPDTGETIRSWDEPNARGQIVAADPAGRRLATVRGEAAVILDADGRRGPVVLAGHEGPVWSVAWEPGGRHAGLGRQRPDDPDLGRGLRPARAADRMPRRPGAVAGLSAPTADGWPRSPASRSSGSGRPSRGICSSRGRRRTRPRSTRWPGAPGAGGSRLRRATGRSRYSRGKPAGPGPRWPGTAARPWRSRGAPTRGGSPRPGQDGTVRIWDVATLQELLVLRGHAGPVWCVAWSPDGRRIASAGADRSLRVWGRRRSK